MVVGAPPPKGIEILNSQSSLTNRKVYAEQQAEPTNLAGVRCCCSDLVAGKWGSQADLE